MQAEVEISKKKEELKGNLKKEYLQTEAEQKLSRNVMKAAEQLQKQSMGEERKITNKKAAQMLSNYQKQEELMLQQKQNNLEKEKK
mgnify:CR=1 FL=1